MDKVLMSLLFSAFLLTGVSFAQTPPPAAPPVAAPTGAPVAIHHHDRHPEIHRALRRLRSAKEDLQKASHDYGGHRDAALGFVNQAIAELQAALSYANAHQ